eukprot:6179150-Pleurochrysis_carterae.AAC.1
MPKSQMQSCVVVLSMMSLWHINCQSLRTKLARHSKQSSEATQRPEPPPTSCAGTLQDTYVTTQADTM